MTSASELDLRRRLFPAFEHRELATSRGSINAMVGGSGPPLLLLHGYPESLLMWHATAPLLAARHTVVATDLAGYGASFRPRPDVAHRAHAKRESACDQVEAMAALGFGSFAVAGHDRGGRVAYRMAIDHPGRVERAAVMDVVPTGEAWARADAKLARTYWHWSFLAQPAPLPERLIAGDPDAFFDLHLRGQLGLGEEPRRYPDEVVDSYKRALRDATAVEAMCEDYRAGAGADVEDDQADRAAGRKIDCPLLVLWAGRGALPHLYPSVIGAWSGWADDLAGAAVEARHFMAEESPRETADQLLGFF